MIASSSPMAVLSASLFLRRAGGGAVVVRARAHQRQRRLSDRRPTTSATGSSSRRISKPARRTSTIPCERVRRSTAAAASGCGRTSARASPSHTSRARTAPTRRRAFPHPFFFNQPREVSPATPPASSGRKRRSTCRRCTSSTRRAAADGVVGRAVVLQRRAGSRDRGHVTESYPYDTATFACGADEKKRDRRRPSTSAPT